MTLSRHFRCGSSASVRCRRHFLECHECGAGFAGIIDPYDEELLLSELQG